MLPFGYNDLGIVPGTTPKEIRLPLAPNQTVVGLVITNETDQNIKVYDRETTEAHPIHIKSGFVRRLEYDIIRGTEFIEIVLQADAEVTTGVVYVDRE